MVLSKEKRKTLVIAHFLTTQEFKKLTQVFYVQSISILAIQSGSHILRVAE